MVLGSVLEFLRTYAPRRPDEALVVAIPSTLGPCRTGQYHVFYDRLFDDLGLAAPYPIDVCIKAAGIVLLGVQGGGKSLAARAIAGLLEGAATAQPIEERVPAAWWSVRAASPDTTSTLASGGKNESA